MSQTLIEHAVKRSLDDVSSGAARRIEKIVMSGKIFQEGGAGC